MFDDILFPTDGSDGATAGLEYVLDVAAAHDATLHLLSVANTTRGALDTLAHDETLEDRAREAVDEAVERARERGVTVVDVVERGNPHRVVCDYAESAGVDVVVMPTRGRHGLERFLLGSTTERVVRRCEVPVLTVRPDGDATATYPFENVLVGVDGSNCSRAALDVGVAVADQEDAALHLLSVVDVAALGPEVRTEYLEDALEADARSVVDAAAAHASSAGVDPAADSVVFGSSVSRAIRKYVQENDVDLLVVGTHGRTGFNRYVLGSVAEFLVRTSPVPVLTVRAPEHEE
jgi:nucleotide-binding universal stress UspA family protein